MPKFEIKSRLDGKILFEAEVGSLKLAVELVVKSRADLFGADLSSAYLSGAYLSGAYLSGADLYRADLSGANLSGADLSRADLSGANLSGANLSGAKLQDESKTVGERPIFQLGPLGSRCAYLVAYLTDKGVRIQAGCFFGSFAEFWEKANATHKATVHGKEYAVAIRMIEAHARLWTPKGKALKEALDEK